MVIESPAPEPTARGASVTVVEPPSAPAPEEAAPPSEAETALAPPEKAPAAPAAAGEVALDLSALEKRGGEWRLEGDKLVGKDGSTPTGHGDSSPPSSDPRFSFYGGK